MNETITPTTEFQFEGRKYGLKYRYQDFAAATRSLRKLGYLDEFKVFQQAAANGSSDMLDVPLIVFIGLCHAVPGLTLERVEAAITWDNINDVAQSVTEAFQTALAPILKRQQEQSDPPEDQPLPFPASGSPSNGPSPDVTSDSPTEISGN